MKLKRIAIVGPESTGKTTLAKGLAEHFNAPWVQEYAREYLNKLEHPYTRQDVEAIAKGQVRWEDAYAATADNLLIVDTNLLVIKVWMEHAYGTCPIWILEEMSQRHYDLYLLTHFDIPYEPDPLREHPEKRDYFFEIYKKELQTLGLNYRVLEGSPEARMQDAIQAVDQFTG